MKWPLRGVPLAAVGLGAALQLAATPPAWAWWTPVLVLPGLAVQFALATGARRPWLASYLLGALHIGAFSWSTRHVAFGGWVAIALLGGLYSLGAAVATRRLAPRLGPLAFALAVAGACWLRAEMPGIGYPHGQSAHVFWRWPWLCAPVALGGEALQNGLLAGIAAAAARGWSSWRLGVPEFRPALRALGLWLVAFGVALFVGRPAESSEREPTVSVVAIETGIHPLDSFADVRDRAGYERRTLQLLRARLLEPTQRVAGPSADAPPDLVLWPESAVPWPIEDRDGALRFDALRGVLDLAPNTRVCLGGALVRDDRDIVAAVLVDARGEFVGHHEKQHLCPGGETLPGIEWLPEAIAGPVRRWLQTSVGVPAALAGRALPPLELPAKGDRPAVPFAALLCYDNAYPGAVAAAVDAGARFCAVLSNEAWFRGGGELQQLGAITVLRAIATRTPFVRCTTDGWSMAVDRDGRLIADLAVDPAPTPAARVLRVDLPLGDGRLPPMARLHPWLGWMAAGAVLAQVLHAILLWAKLLRLGQATAVRDGRRSEA